MTDPRLFWTIFAAVLGAGLLIVCFVWACLNISRKETRKESYGTYMLGALFPIAFFGLAFYIAMGGT